MRQGILVALLAMLSVASAAQGRPSEHYIELRDVSRDDLEALSQVVSIDRVAGEEVRAYATDRSLGALRERGYHWRELPHPGDNPAVRMAASVADFRSSWSTYPTYSQYIEMMEAYQARFPDICRLEQIGLSQEGRELLVVKISDHLDLEEAEPEVLYTSTMHGDETVGYVLMLRLVDDLLTNYDEEAEITNLINNLEIWINPLANPDGTYAGGDDTVRGARRTLANGVDPNRNFPDPQEGEHPDGRAWALETIAMMDFAAQQRFVLSVNFHGGAQVVNYPWDTWPRLHADDDWFEEISRRYADQAQADGPSGYMDDLENGITNGYQWYEVDGGRQDYMTFFEGGRELTIELSSTKTPHPKTLPRYWRANRQALLDYMKNTLEGVHGVVMDEEGLPVAATVEVVGHDIDGSQVLTDADVGDYYRFLAPGTYSFLYSAPGWAPQRVDDVLVRDGVVTRVDVQLTR